MSTIPESSLSSAIPSFDEAVNNTIIYIDQWQAPEDIKKSCLDHLKSRQNDTGLRLSRFRSIFDYGKNVEFDHIKKISSAWSFFWTDMIDRRDLQALAHWRSLTDHLDPDLLITKTSSLFQLLDHDGKIWYMQNTHEMFRRDGTNKIVFCQKTSVELHQYWWIAEMLAYFKSQPVDQTDIQEHAQLMPPESLNYECKKMILDNKHCHAWLSQQRVVELLLWDVTNEEELKNHLPLTEWLHTPHMSTAFGEMIMTKKVPVHMRTMSRIYGSFTATFCTILKYKDTPYSLRELLLSIQRDYSTKHPVYVATIKACSWIQEELKNTNDAALTYFVNKGDSDQHLDMLKSIGVRSERLMDMIASEELAWSEKTSGWLHNQPKDISAIDLNIAMLTQE